MSSRSNQIKQSNAFLQHIINTGGGKVSNYNLYNNKKKKLIVITKNNLSRISNNNKITKIYPLLRPNFFDPNTIVAITKKKSILGHLGNFAKSASGVAAGAAGAAAGFALQPVKHVALGVLKPVGKGIAHVTGHGDLGSAIINLNSNRVTTILGKKISNAAGFTNANSPEQIETVLRILYGLQLDTLTAAEKRYAGQLIGSLVGPLVYKFSYLPPTINEATGKPVRGKMANLKNGVLNYMKSAAKQRLKNAAAKRVTNAARYGLQTAAYGLQTTARGVQTAAKGVRNAVTRRKNNTSTPNNTRLSKANLEFLRNNMYKMTKNQLIAARNNAEYGSTLRNMYQTYKNSKHW
jgi:hypothetical protein